MPPPLLTTYANRAEKVNEVVGGRRHEVAGRVARDG